MKKLYELLNKWERDITLRKKQDSTHSMIGTITMERMFHELRETLALQQEENSK